MTNNENIKITVVIPVYNVEPYLKKCLDSVICQTLRDIEIILIGDGSTDSSGAICDEYGSRDERIRVIHKKNEGLSCARNDGIDAARAPYIMFVDSDDWVEPEFCEKPYRMAVENNADMVLFKANHIYVTPKNIKKNESYTEGLLSKEEAFSFNVDYLSTAWIGLYRKELFDNIRFPTGRFFEDIGTTYKLIREADKIGFVDSYLYNYVIGRQGSITTAPDTKDHPDWLSMRMARINDLCAWGYEKCIRNDAFTMLICYSMKGYDRKALIKVIENMSDEPPQTLSFKRKMLLRMFNISPKLFDAICILTGKRIR